VPSLQPILPPSFSVTESPPLSLTCCLLPTSLSLVPSSLFPLLHTLSPPALLSPVQALFTCRPPDSRILRCIEHSPRLIPGFLMEVFRVSLLFLDLLACGSCLLVFSSPLCAYTTVPLTPPSPLASSGSVLPLSLSSFPLCCSYLLIPSPGIGDRHYLFLQALLYRILSPLPFSAVCICLDSPNIYPYRYSLVLPSTSPRTLIQHFLLLRVYHLSFSISSPFSFFAFYPIYLLLSLHFLAFNLPPVHIFIFTHKEHLPSSPPLRLPRSYLNLSAFSLSLSLSVSSDPLFLLPASNTLHLSSLRYPLTHIMRLSFSPLLLSSSFPFSLP